jgi:hypothetical protein
MPRQFNILIEEIPRDWDSNYSFKVYPTDFPADAAPSHQFVGMEGYDKACKMLGFSIPEIMDIHGDLITEGRVYIAQRELGDAAAAAFGWDRKLMQVGSQIPPQHRELALEWAGVPPPHPPRPQTPRETSSNPSTNSCKGRSLDLEPTDQPPIDTLRPFPADEMEAFEVSKDVGNVKNNSAEFLNSK